MPDPADDDIEDVSQAMHTFLARGNLAAFENAVAVFVRSARERAEPIEQVLGTLNRLTEEHEGARYPHDFSQSDLRRLALRAVLLAFYGDEDEENRSVRRPRPADGDSAPRDLDAR